MIRLFYRPPFEATGLGIGMLYQDPLDFPPLSVLENFMMGLSGSLYSSERPYLPQLKDMAGGFEFHPDQAVPVHRLPVGERQQLELLRLLTLGIGVLILDKPTTGI